MRLSISLALALTIALVATAPASAGQVCVVNGAATFVANDMAAACGAANAPSEVNSLKVDTNAAGDIVFTDTNPITDADGPGGCTTSGNSATCPRGAGYTFSLGDGADTAVIGNAPAAGISSGDGGADTLTGGPAADALDGGPGNDTINGGAGNDFLVGGSGDDIVSGGDGNDSLDGGDSPGACIGSGGSDVLNGDAGDDLLCGGSGPAGGVSDADALNGGDGVDHAFYPASAAVTVSLDGAANDGVPGEGDNVRPDVEQLTGGSGNDTLVGNDGPNLLDGGAGADRLSGLGGNDVLTDSGGDSAADTLDGGAGDDTLSAGAGPDVYVGGDGEDAVVDYVGRSASVSVTLDGVADDGQAGEGDNVGADVEDVTGGSAADTLIGNASDNELVGGAGDDTISGGGGNDGLLGQAGRDTIDGGAGRDLIDGGAGPDVLKSRDGLTDRVQCAGGTDSVQGEARDDIAGDCENLDIAPPTAMNITSVVVTRAGFVVVRVACPIVERSCTGSILVKTVRRIANRFIRVGQVNYRVRGGTSAIFRATIAAGDRTPLRRARRVKVRTMVSNVNNDTGAQTTATRLDTVTTRGL